MASERKQLEATLRNKIAKQYTGRIENLEERLKECAKALAAERSRRLEAERQLEPLKEKVEQYEDWINRLQEFVNMPDGTREREFKVYMAELKSREHIQDLTKMFGGLFTRL